jgi:hypothetical protein
MMPTPKDNGLFAYCTSSICNSSCAERSVLLEMRSGLRRAELNALSNAISHAKFFSRSLEAVVCVYDEARDVIDPVGFIPAVVKAIAASFQACVTFFALAPWI